MNFTCSINLWDWVLCGQAAKQATRTLFQMKAQASKINSKNPKASMDAIVLWAIPMYLNKIKNYLTALVTKALARNSPIKPWTGFFWQNFCIFFAAETFGSVLPKHKCLCQDFVGGSHAFGDCSRFLSPQLTNPRVSDQVGLVTKSKGQFWYLCLFFFLENK